VAGGWLVVSDVEGSKRSGAIGSAVRLRFASLPTRIIVSVFAAALGTGLAVTLLSTSSTEAFLRSKIETRFPEALRETAEDLERWYAQREVDVTTFASSATLIGSLHRVGGSADEAQRYLAYVRDGYPLYRALFVLDREGRVRVSVGDDTGVAPGRLASFASTQATSLSEALRTPAGAIQLASTPLVAGGERIGTLVASIDLSSLGELLAEERIDEATALHLVDAHSVVVASSSPRYVGRRLDRPFRTEGGAAAPVEDYTTPEGEHRVGSALPFVRLEWTLVIEQDYDMAFAPVVSAIGNLLAINLFIVGVFGVLALSIARSIAKPIRLLSDAAHRIAQGETEVEIPRVEGQDEIGVLSRALHGMVERLWSNQVELERKQEQIERANASLTRANQDLHRSNEVLEQLSFTDGLTQLHNHRYFQDRMRVEAKRCDRTGEPLALLLVDIDDFKKLNDRHGHAAGDEVLRRVARVLNDGVRETDLPARYGGEEFAVLAPRTGDEGAHALAEKLREIVAQERFGGVEGADSDAVLRVTVSVGAAIYGGDVKRLFIEADRALYRAKAEGKDCVVLFSDDG